MQKQLAQREQEIAQHRNERRSRQADSHLVVELQAQLVAARNENMALAAQSSALAATMEHGTLSSAQRQREADSRAAQVAANWQKRAEENAAAAEAALALLNDSKIEITTHLQRIQELEQKKSPAPKQEADQEQEAELEANRQHETLECYTPGQQAHRIQMLETDLLFGIATHCSPAVASSAMLQDRISFPTRLSTTNAATAFFEALNEEHIDGVARTPRRLHVLTASESTAEECIETALAQERKLFEKQLSQERAEMAENLAQMLAAKECEFSNAAKSKQEALEAAHNALFKQTLQNHESALAAEQLKCTETEAALSNTLSERDHALKNLANVTAELKSVKQRLEQNEAEALQRTDDINAQLQAAQRARHEAEEHANLERDSCAAEIAVMELEVEQLKKKMHDIVHEGKRECAELVSRHEVQQQQAEMTANAQADELRAEIATLMDVTVEEQERAANEIQALRLKNNEIAERLNLNCSSEFDAQRQLQQCTKACEEKMQKQEADHAATVAQMQTDFVNRSHAAIEIQEGLKAQHKADLNQAVQRHANDLQNLEEKHRSSMDSQRIAAEKILRDALNAERARLHDQHSTDLRTAMLQKEEEQQAALKQQAQELEAAQQSKKEQLQIALQEAFNAEQRRQQQCHIKELERVRAQVDQKWQAKYKAAVEEIAAKINDKAQEALAENTRTMKLEREAAASAAAQAQRVAIAQAISEQKSEMQEAAQRDKEAHEAALQHLRAQHTAELLRAAESHENRAQERLRSLQQEHEKNISAAKHAALAESAAREAQYKERLMLVKQEHEAALQNETQAHQAATAAAIDAKEKKFGEKMRALEHAHVERTAALATEHQSNVKVELAVKEAELRAELRADYDKLKRKHKDDIMQLEAKITASAARVSDTGDASMVRLRHKLKEVKRKGREYVEQMTAVHKTELQEVQAKLNKLEQACMAANEREQCTAAKLTELQSLSEQAALHARDHLADMQKQLSDSKLAVQQVSLLFAHIYSDTFTISPFPPSHKFSFGMQKNNQIAELVRQTQTQALHYTKHEAAPQDCERHSGHTVGGINTSEQTTNTSERHNCKSNSGGIEGRSCIAKRRINSPVLARPKKDVARSCIRHAQAKALSPRGVSPRMGRHLMPELNGSIWRPMSPLESSPNHAIPVRPFAFRRAHPDATSTPSSQSKSSRSRLLRQLSTGQEAESWAAEVLRSIDF